MNFKGCVRTFVDSLQAIGEDFIKDKTFWFAVVLAILPCVLLATKFRSNLPQLVVTAEVVRQQYALKGQALQDREEFLQGLKGKIERVFPTQIAAPFATPSGSLAEGGESYAFGYVYDQSKGCESRYIELHNIACFGAVDRKHCESNVVVGICVVAEGGRKASSVAHWNCSPLALRQ